ncbi:GGDEF domain-containing protein [Janthinobacterium sp. 17J80-10]|uniref:GGDEF domain-containing protein n=1 Tax=Janthinobacterium sp. 17J80-10 TaxID=2497863 RepID=UPI0010058274|nr:GGDEF domain-containing protein [Janthinobacterium sp. 17J80-10]QAU32731.1 GGDEF domain-containing protein [Janthinobacterium sp. 17J80-10]
MENLLKHLVEITGHRDHNLLDISVISALSDLAGARQARVLEIFRVREETFVRPRVWLKDGKAISTEEHAEGDQTGEPIGNFPALLTCIEQHRDNIEETTANNEYVMWIPVWLNEKVSTCLHIVNSAPYSPAMKDVMSGILNVYRNFQNLLDYSERDSLTGLLNRKTFDEKFSKMTAYIAPPDSTGQEGDERRSSDEVREHWMAMVDIDHFKRINDTFGHIYGDEVLILVANLLRASFRAQDRIFRFGGEEFMILLRSSTLEDARKIFERFRTSVEQYNFPQVGQVTVSLGFVRISAQTPVVLVGHADQALYYAKTHGRNQICHYEQLIAEGLLHSGVSNDSVEFF